MNGLSCGEESMTICSAILIQYQRVTDGRTDGRTDVKPIAITCFSIADARKKQEISQQILLLICGTQSFHINYSDMIVVCSDIHLIGSPVISAEATRMQDLASKFSKKFPG